MLSYVIKLYQEARQKAEALGIQIDPDGLPDPLAVDEDLNYHLELVDLLGMCAKGRNDYTEKYCKDLFSEDDIMAVLGLSQTPIFIRSPFVRLLHGVYFSAAIDDTAVVSEYASAHVIMTQYWQQLVELFASFERDITRFRKWLERDQEEEAIENNSSVLEVLDPILEDDNGDLKSSKAESELRPAPSEGEEDEVRQES